MRQMIASEPNSRMLLNAVETGLIPQSMFDDMDEAQPCGLLEGDVVITSELFVPEKQQHSVCHWAVSSLSEPRKCRRRY